MFESDIHVIKLRLADRLTYLKTLILQLIVSKIDINETN
jgi:hypothetical protein